MQRARKWAWRLTVFAILAWTSAPIQAETNEIDGITWTYTITQQDSNDESTRCVTITSVSGDLTGDVTIPSTLDGWPVTSIGDYAFSGCRLRGVTIPDSVTSIGMWTFSYCYDLHEVVFPNGMTNIGHSAFSDCYNLEEVTIPKGVQHIDSFVFSMCDSLQKVTICEGVQSIGDAAFEDCRSLREVSLPNSITRIGDSAFWGCSIGSVTIPSSVEFIGFYAFDSVTNLSCGASCRLHDAFILCSDLKSITIIDGITYIAPDVFEFMDTIETVVIPDSVTGIGMFAFFGCSSLRALTLPMNVKEIGEWAFAGTALENLAVPASVERIGSHAFAGCDILKTVVFEERSWPVSFGSAVFAGEWQDLNPMPFRMQRNGELEPLEWTGWVDEKGIKIDLWQENNFSSSDKFANLFPSWWVKERSHSDVWGTWSDEGGLSFEMPEAVSSWENIASVLWRARDSSVRGTNAALPPTEGPVVLSLGAVAVPDEMMASDDPLETEREHGVDVWRLRVFEDVDQGCLFGVIGSSVFKIADTPSYLPYLWTRDVYGSPPDWLSNQETDAWFTMRARSRIEWFVTLVPQSKWVGYCEKRAEDANEAEEANGPPLVLEGIRTDVNMGIHGISVKSLAAGETWLLGNDRLSQTNWTCKGLSLQSRGTTTAGAFSSGNQFFKAVFAPLSEDRDNDGIPDILEEKVYGTDPDNADSSGDGISDWEKAYRYALNPHVRDTDGDGFDDDEEIIAATDPRVPAKLDEQDAARVTIRYHYDEDDRLTGTFFGRGEGSATTVLSPAGNPTIVQKRGK